MFSFFRKKQGSVKFIDRVFITAKAKREALLEELRRSPGTILIAWFEESMRVMEEALASSGLPGQVLMAREAAHHHVAGQPVVFIERYPLGEKEIALAEKLHLEKYIAYSGLDEPLFLHFGGERIGMLAERLGLAPTEALEHAMISGSIRNAQEKLATKISTEFAATSQEEWFRRNLHAT